MTEEGERREREREREREERERGERETSVEGGASRESDQGTLVLPHTLASTEPVFTAAGPPYITCKDRFKHRRSTEIFIL